MEIVIHQVTSDEDVSAMLEVRGQVFLREMGITPAPDGLAGFGDVSHLLARLGPGGEAVGTLSVVDTSGARRLREAYRLGFDADARSARLMHLAVLRPFRGLNIPLMMALEAHRRVIAPRGYDYTWLLFDAERAPTSFLSRWLGFNPRADTFVSEYGRRCPLVRDERAADAEAAVRRAGQFLRQSAALYAQAEPAAELCASGA